MRYGSTPLEFAKGKNAIIKVGAVHRIEKDGINCWFLLKFRRAVILVRTSSKDMRTNTLGSKFLRSHRLFVIVLPCRIPAQVIEASEKFRRVIYGIYC